MAVDSDLLKGKYPAKAHAKKVAEYIKSKGGDANGVIYLEAQRTRMNEVCTLYICLIASS